MIDEKAIELTRRLTKSFWIMLSPVIVLFVLSFLAHLGPISVVPPHSLRAWGIVLLVLSVTLCVALPILLRSLFHERAVRRKTVEYWRYERFQVRQLAIVVSGAAFAGLAYLFIVPKLHLYGSVLAALYGIYSVVPARKKFAGEMKYYQIREK
jgi:hypothetical protein